MWNCNPMMMIPPWMGWGGQQEDPWLRQMYRKWLEDQLKELADSKSKKDKDKDPKVPRNPTGLEVGMGLFILGELLVWSGILHWPWH